LKDTGDEDQEAKDGHDLDVTMMDDDDDDPPWHTPDEFGRSLVIRSTTR
jgi:hypothetical protein